MTTALRAVIRLSPARPATVIACRCNSAERTGLPASTRPIHRFPSPFHELQVQAPPCRHAGRVVFLDRPGPSTGLRTPARGPGRPGRGRLGAILQVLNGRPLSPCRSIRERGPRPALSFFRSTEVHRLRGEPRQCGDRAHRLVAPSLAPTGERRPSMACLRPIPAPPRLSPSECPWFRRCRFRQVPPKRRTPRSRRTSLQGDFVRAVHGCTAPACWSRTRNHAADEIPLQRRPRPKAGLLLWTCRGGPMPPLNMARYANHGCPARLRAGQRAAQLR